MAEESWANFVTLKRKQYYVSSPAKHPLLVSNNFNRTKTLHIMKCHSLRILQFMHLHVVNTWCTEGRHDVISGPQTTFHGLYTHVFEHFGGGVFVNVSTQ